jgi:hypothetical protein
MTTLAAIVTKDALIMGCDSLASVTVPMVDPFALLNYFDPDKEFEIKIDETGKPLLKNFHILYDYAQSLPYNHMTHVDKLFSLAPLEMGVMTTGLASIGNFTIKNLINQFKSSDKAFKTGKQPSNYTVKSVSERLLKFIYKHYETEFANRSQKPYLEFMIGGYDKQKHIPNILRIYIHENRVEETIESFGIVFGGQMTEIQRIVFGTDSLNKIKLINRTKDLLNHYYEQVLKFLKDKDINIDIPAPTIENYSVFEGWSLNAFDANWGDFSEKNAIACVRFFIEIMIKSQEFSSTLPTVGGDVHVAIITKTEGFKPA